MSYAIPNLLYSVTALEMVILTALGIGGATVVGAALGFLFKDASHKLSDCVLAFAAGVMLAAAVLGLILPSVEQGGRLGVLVSTLGIFSGAVCINFLDKAMPSLYKVGGAGERGERVLLFVTAVAIHNLPEGIAAGVGFGTDSVNGALLIALGIALHNIPEGMVIISPLLSVGMRPRRVFLIAAATGLFEVVGTLVGYFAVSFSEAVLPFALAFAGGTMLYVISDEMIPETHSDGNQRGATYALLAGFCLMLAFNSLMS